MIKNPINPTDYFGTHSDALRSYGGYAPNMPLSSATAGLTGAPRPKMETSTSRRDYVPHAHPCPETSLSTNVFLGRSGYSVAKATHLPRSIDIMRTNRDKASEFYHPKSRLSPDTCTVPTSLLSETNERFHPNANTIGYCGAGSYNAKNYWIESPGSRESGFTSGFKTINPVFWRQQEPMMDQLGKNPPEVRLNAASVSQTDYRPHSFVNYESTPIQGILQVRAANGTGFRTAKELKPCFLPEPCVYGQHTPSFLGDPSRYDTVYNTDYRGRQVCQDFRGCELIGRGNALKLTIEQSPDFSLGCGPPRTFISETREKFPNFWPLDGQRTFGLSKPIGSVSSSGFCHSVKKHAPRENYCEGVSRDPFDTSPQRYNPWPKFYLGHRTMIDKGYRPNPAATGIDYTVTTSLPTTGANAEPCLY